MKPTKRDVLAGTCGDITAINYARLLSVLFDLPASLSSKRRFTNRERNAVRRANLLKKKYQRKYAKSLHQRPHNGD